MLIPFWRAWYLRPGTFYFVPLATLISEGMSLKPNLTKEKYKMTKVYLQPGLRALSGGMGDWVYQLRNGKTYLGMKPLNGKEPSEAQVAQRERFKQAAAYAHFAMADNDARAIYEEISALTDTPVFALMVADYLKPPKIKNWDVSMYTGKVGDNFVVYTSDDVGVINVNIKITDDQGAIVESSYASESKPGTGIWVYTAKTAVAAGKDVTIEASAFDRPGGMAVNTTTKTL